MPLGSGALLYFRRRTEGCREPIGSFFRSKSRPAGRPIDLNKPSTLIVPVKRCSKNPIRRIFEPGAAHQMYEEIWTVNVDDHGGRKALRMLVEVIRAVTLLRRRKSLLSLLSRPWCGQVGVGSPLDSHDAVP